MLPVVGSRKAIGSPSIIAMHRAQIFSIAETEQYFMTPSRKMVMTDSTSSPLPDMMQTISKGEIACHWQLPTLGQ
ncbi:hypothetical protein [Pectobacterium colocasium]|uniref:hypothetical protein n=1 Tax=Pectobacterium colocasium TaxID=2878098 RepID=UPI001CD35D87|nr:hypothetical protein [Pectobacterium colocasium]